jgi:hypothetical protein
MMNRIFQSVHLALFVKVAFAGPFIFAASVATALDADSYLAHESGAGRFALATGGQVAPIVVSTEDWPGVVRAAKDL